MSFKVVETDSEYPEVLLYLDVTEDGKDCVVIKAYGVKLGVDSDNIENWIAETLIVFPNISYARSFIRDFSIESGNMFCEGHGVKYQSI
jgi:hypothetical protein